LEKDFNFAATARKRFAESDLKTKRPIFTELGSNFLLKDGKVSLELDETLFAIQKGKEITTAKFPRIELVSKGMNKPQTNDPQSQIPIWSAWLHATRTFLHVPI